MQENKEKVSALKAIWAYRNQQSLEHHYRHNPNKISITSLGEDVIIPINEKYVEEGMNNGGKVRTSVPFGKSLEEKIKRGKGTLIGMIDTTPIDKKSSNQFIENKYYLVHLYRLDVVYS